ncbi:MAG: hypothetical protein Q9169_006855 [Polycauliona sp. 2 TL-2023]
MSSRSPDEKDPYYNKIRLSDLLIRHVTIWIAAILESTHPMLETVTYNTSCGGLDSGKIPISRTNVHWQSALPPTSSTSTDPFDLKSAMQILERAPEILERKIYVAQGITECLGMAIKYRKEAVELYKANRAKYGQHTTDEKKIKKAKKKEKIKPWKPEKTKRPRYVGGRHQKQIDTMEESQRVLLEAVKLGHEKLMIIN